MAEPAPQKMPGAKHLVIKSIAAKSIRNLNFSGKHRQPDDFYRSNNYQGKNNWKMAAGEDVRFASPRQAPKVIENSTKLTNFPRR